MPGWPQAIIFDFDGIVMNSEPLHFRAFQEVLGAEGIALGEKEYYAELIGFDDRGAIRHMLSKHHRPTDEAAFARLIAAKTRRMQEIIRAGLIAPLPGVGEFVRGLRDYPLAICSGALRAEIEMMLDGVGLRESFPVLVAAEDVAIGKPDPSGYLQTLRLVSERVGHRLQPRDALIIEDAPNVIESVKRGGFRVLGVATTCRPDELTAADFVVSTLRPAEVLAKIPQLKIHPPQARN
jgi:HAD superfamily hydrolase (TIGR01509 family)